MLRFLSPLPARHMLWLISFMSKRQCDVNALSSFQHRQERRQRTRCNDRRFIHRNSHQKSQAAIYRPKDTDVLASTAQLASVPAMADLRVGFALRDKKVRISHSPLLNFILCAPSPLRNRQRGNIGSRRPVLNVLIHHTNGRAEAATCCERCPL